MPAATRPDQVRARAPSHRTIRPAARAPMMKPVPIAVSATPNSRDDACRSLVTKNTFSALNVFFVTSDLHASSRLFGVAETAMGTGFIIGALAAGRMVRWLGARALTWSGLVAAGILAAGYALQRSFPAGLVL